MLNPNNDDDPLETVIGDPDSVGVPHGRSEARQKKSNSGPRFQRSLDDVMEMRKLRYQSGPILGVNNWLGESGRESSPLLGFNGPRSGPVGHNNRPPVGHNNRPPVGHNNRSPVGHNNRSPVGHNNRPPGGHNNRSPVGHNNRSPVGHNNRPSVGADPNFGRQDVEFPRKGVASGLTALRNRLRTRFRGDNDHEGFRRHNPSSTCGNNLQMGSSSRGEAAFRIVIALVEDGLGSSSSGGSSSRDYMLVVAANEPFHGIIGAVSGGEKGEPMDVLAAEAWSKMPIGIIKLGRQSCAVLFVHRQWEVCVLTIDVIRALKDLREQLFRGGDEIRCVVSPGAARIHCLFDTRRQPIRFDPGLNCVSPGQSIPRATKLSRSWCCWSSWSSHDCPTTLSLAQAQFLETGTSWLAEQYLTLCGNDKHTKILASF